jgi:uncharacterized protein (TIGR03067 family)
MKRNRWALLIVGGLFLATWAPALGQQGDKAQMDTDRLQGTWTVRSATEMGKSVLTTEEIRFIIKDNEITVEVGGVKKEKMTFTLDPSKMPRTIDLMHRSDGTTTQTAQGIYELDQDGKPDMEVSTFKLCVIKPGKGPRPTDMKTTSADVTCITLEMKREKKK